jgi:hypothetical protein
MQVRPGTGGVALVEDQIQQVQDHAQPAGPLGRQRQHEPGADVTDALLGPTDPLRHGGLRDQERGGDLGGGQATHRPHGERELRRR